MERRKFVKSSLVGASAVSTGFMPFNRENKTDPKEIIELREYELKSKGRQAALDKYIKDALIPALNKNGIKNIGAFIELSKSEPVKLYLLIPYPSYDDYFTTTQKVKEDSDYIKASQEYNNIPLDNLVYYRYSSRLMLAFDSFPKLKAPANEQRIFELRTYEGYSEDAVRRKILMFNKEEIGIFLKTQLKPVFFGEVIFGKDLPCLTYMVVFKDMEERDKNWKNFSSDPDWARISKAPEYADTVSKITRIFLEPLNYSQV